MYEPPIDPKISPYQNIIYKSKTYREFQWKFLDDEIHHKRKVLRSLKSRYKTLENNVKNVVSVLDMVYFKFHLYRNFETVINSLLIS